MRLRIMFMICVMGASLVQAQQFHHAYTIQLPDSIVAAQPSRVDLNNDGLLDLLLITSSTSGRAYLQVVKGDTVSTPFLQGQATRVAGTLKSFVVTDYDRDNLLDVVMSTTTGRVAVYLNNGDFTFSENMLALPAFTALLIADLDEDAIPEWILSDHQASENKLMIFRQASAFMWSLAHDSLKVAAQSMAVADQNYDGRHDVFLSGVVSADSVVSTVLINDGRLGLTPSRTFDFAGKVSGADVNADGRFDFVVMGTNQAGVAATHLYRSAAGSHDAVNLSVNFTEGSPFLADMNSDGIVDYNYRGKASLDTLNILQYAENDFDTISSAGYRSHVFGDEDRDGDLDLLVVLRTTRTQLLSYTNMTHINLPPSMPKNAVVLPVFDRTFFYWDPSADDHTPQTSLTYDLYIDGARAFAAEFDLLNEKRLSVTHGNNGTQNFRLFRKTPGTQFAVQAVDNAFHASSPCIGSGSGCGTVSTVELLLCEGESSTLQAPHEVLWFSFSKGYLGQDDVLSLSGGATDTVFYYDPVKKGCDGLKVFTVVVVNDALRSTVERYACEGQSMHFEVEAGWNLVTWKSFKDGVLGTGQSMDRIVSGPDTITAIMTNGAGCTRRDKTVVKISAPVLKVIPDAVRIAVGSSVELAASGADRYEWLPAVGLSAVNVSNPVASPSLTTVYEVTGYDSLSCSSTAQATVTVESGGFVPNLFTPNEDGKNDEIKIYGLTEVHDFVFTIHNREGSIVYRTNKLSEAMQKGWDGSLQGTRQPAGVYFWKVKGELGSGERLLLNGKDSGSIVLVR